jgi:hypothetical protein
MKKIIVTTLVLTAVATALTTQTSFANNSNSALQKVATTQALNKKIWLGVSLAPVPKALGEQLGDLIPKNQGVMIQSVSPDSPASKAGLKAYDVLLSFNDQQLYSAQQLAGLVSSSVTDSDIKMSLVRQGKKQNVSVKLGAHAIASQPLAPRARHPFIAFNNHGFNNQPFGRPFMQPFSQPIFPQPVVPSMPSGKQGNANIMQQFESINIQQTGDGKVRAEVSFDNNGDKKEFNFEGKIDEVRKQIKETKDIPEDKKNGLLNTLQNKPNQLIPDDFFKDFQQMPAFPSFDNFYNQQPQVPSWFNNGSKF